MNRFDLNRITDASSRISLDLKRILPPAQAWLRDLRSALQANSTAAAQSRATKTGRRLPDRVLKPTKPQKRSTLPNRRA